MAHCETVLIGTSDTTDQVVARLREVLGGDLRPENDWLAGELAGYAVDLEADDLWPGYTHALDVYGLDDQTALANTAVLARKLRAASVPWRLAVTVGDEPVTDLDAIAVRQTRSL
jgi:hypothetical protein